MTKLTSITKANAEDFQLLADIGKVSFIESHGNSASEDDINMYVSSKYNYDVFKQELNDPKSIYYLIHHDKQPAGYSKIILNAPHSNIQIENVTKLERLYLLKEFYSLKLGLELFNFNLELSKQNNQAGMWLFVWKENQRAVSFYKKTGFKVIGNYDFKLTETHSNPNHQMLLMY
ncbi:MAG: N-acetyltransferase [Runella slithyformis]|nr:MAG: N-acetyltransferase [Runella slithyformis]TAF28911.1 MAG: N-acetyltransferase [Runella slithyformis]TAF47964.1 MAG: N-acetyltransferase [Runella slithyformis]TAF82450.1 MAG: N-acetyltransferase [Runella slithyformis]